MIFDWCRSVVAIQHLSAVDDQLALPAELLLIEGEPPNRRRQFLGGRQAAREAARPLGYELGPVLVGQGGEPLWPAGIVGSISHVGHFAAAAIGRSSDLTAVGIDLDDARRLEGPAAASVANPSELQAVVNLGWAGREWAANAVFCAKEAVFKCQFAMTGRRDLAFSQVTLELATDSPEMRCSTTESALAPAISTIRVQMRELLQCRIALAIAD